MPTTFKEIEAVVNGAQFINADLHVHSFGASHDVTDPTMTVEAIIDEAVRMNIRLLAITDHNTDANTQKSIDYAQKYTGQILVLPGVEVTTSHGHLLAYFDPKNAADVRNLLGKINIVGRLGDQNSHTAMSMADVIKQVELLGGVCIAAHIDRSKTGFEMLAEGYPNWKKDILLSPGLYGLEFDDPANLGWYSEADGPTGADRKQIARARATVPQLAGRPFLARVQGSDAHRLHDFTTGRSGKILTRFKLDELNYEAFRTALSDPDARVRAVASIPRSVPRVLGMKTSGGFLDRETYHFSDNLNCFIGGRGTGKSSALQILAHGLGASDDMEEHDNCPDSVIIYAEDANGTVYRYERLQGSKPVVTAKTDGTVVNDVPVDAFRVEYYSQGELATISKNPLKNPLLLQQFLDRHLTLSDLLGKQDQLVTALEQNSAQLIPLEGNAQQLAGKNKTLAEINNKLAIAEAGKLKDIAADQGSLANEKTFAASLGKVKSEYGLGLSLSNFIRDYAALEAAVRPLTNDPDCNAALLKVKGAIESVNTLLKEKERDINAKFRNAANEIETALGELRQSQARLETQLNVKVKGLQQKGLSGSIAELQNLLKQKGGLTLEINNIKNQASQLKQLWSDRERYLAELAKVREEIMQRRKAQLNSINQNLASTIEDYNVFVHYEPSGIIDDFKKFFLDRMHGTWFQEEAAGHFCSRITPAELAKFVLNEDVDAISNATGIDKGWAQQVCKQLRFYEQLHQLEVMWKTPCPIITVKTKGATPKNIPVNQLSDGQKHTIMLTIAMLAESNIPLVIDQPEDDLDNAFIFTTVVKALRSIKERRQVILVTHNANIAVLGDAELLLPMRRTGDKGVAFDRGSIDKAETKKAVLNILEGGDIAFRRRREIYGH